MKTNINLLPLSFSVQAKEVDIQGDWALVIGALFILFYSQIKEVNSSWLKL